MNSRFPKLAPSLLAADFGRVAEELARVKDSGAGILHLDIMDGQFVPNLTFGPKMIQDIRAISDLTLDVHLMIEAPERSADMYIDAGADYLTFHAEACVHSHRLIERIRARGVKVGLAIVPGTPISAVEPLLDDIDLLLIMTVNPGFGGQTLIPFCVEKIRKACSLRQERGQSFLIECDGGVNDTTAGELLAAGTDILVAGSAFFASAQPEALVRIVEGVS